MNPIKIGQQIAKRLLAEELTEKVSIYPGAFKPPHKGHVRAALSSIDDKTDKVIIFMSSKERDGVSVEEAQKVWDLYKANIPELDKIEIVQTPTPVTAVYDYAKDNPTHDIRAVFGKGEQERFKSLLDKEKYPHVEVFDSGTVGSYSATDLRKALRDNDIEKIKEFLPDEVNIDDFLAIFQDKNSLNEIGDLSQQPYSWKYLPDNSDDTTKVYRFEAKDNIQYEVNLYYVGSYNDKGDWTLEFLAKAPGLGGYSSKALTGGGEPLKIMSTIVDITKAFVKDNGNVGRIVYTPTEGKSGERDAKDNIRGKLYKAIIQKNFPQAKVTGSDNSAVIVDLTKQPLNESWHPNKARIINRFIDYATNYLSIDRPTIKLINTPDYTQHNHSFGGYMPSEKKLLVVVYNRNMADILRTLAHELVHHMQNLDDRLQPDSGMDGSPEENEANSLAAVIMRKFGRENPEIYE